MLNRNIQATKQEVQRMQNSLRNNNNNNGNGNASNRLQRVTKNLDQIQNLGNNIEHRDAIDQNMMAMLNGMVDQLHFKAQRIAFESNLLNHNNFDRYYGNNSNNGGNSGNNGGNTNNNPNNNNNNNFQMPTTMNPNEMMNNNQNQNNQNENNLNKRKKRSNLPQTQDNVDLDKNGNVLNQNKFPNNSPSFNNRRNKRSNLPNIANLDENGNILDTDKLPVDTRRRKKRDALQDLVNSLPSLSKLSENGNLLDPDKMPDLSGLPDLNSLLPDIN